MKKQTLGRSERLKSVKSISELFETGNSLSVPPIRLLYLLRPSVDIKKSKIGFAVPKKNFKRAVDRNLIKRRMREAYRLNKLNFINEIDGTFPGLDIILVYQGKQIEDYTVINTCIIALLKKLKAKKNIKVKI